MLDFNHLERYRENNRIEAKQAIGGLPESLWETYSAFANTEGGVILLGVEELKDKSLHAVELPAPEKLVTEFWDMVNLPFVVSKNILKREDIQLKKIDGKVIIIINVPKAQKADKPVYIGRDIYAGSYIRNGEGDCRCTHQQVRQMVYEAQLAKEIKW